MNDHIKVLVAESNGFVKRHQDLELERNRLNRELVAEKLKTKELVSLADKHYADKAISGKVFETSKGELEKELAKCKGDYDILQALVYFLSKDDGLDVKTSQNLVNAWLFN